MIQGTILISLPRTLEASLHFYMLLLYQGFIEVMKGLVKLGLIDETPHVLLHPKGPEITWVRFLISSISSVEPMHNLLSFLVFFQRQFMCQLMGQSPDILVDSLKDLIYQTADNDEKFVADCIE